MTGVKNIFVAAMCIFLVHCKESDSLSCDVVKTIVSEAINDKRAEQYYINVNGQFPAFYINDSYSCIDSLAFNKFNRLNRVREIDDSTDKRENAVVITIKKVDKKSVSIRLEYKQQGIVLNKKYSYNGMGLYLVEDSFGGV
ncbi:MAG: hypothetical protein QM731_06440 [Chitinophagaceae bacterium]